jgi:hypothetical protein
MLMKEKDLIRGGVKNIHASCIDPKNLSVIRLILHLIQEGL